MISLSTFSHNYTPEKLTSFSYSQLIDMRNKAIKYEVEDLLKMVLFELDRRPAPKPTKPKRTVLIKNLERKISDELETIGRQLSQKFDLSEETAREISKTRKGFVPHLFLSTKGKPKNGRARKLGFASIEIYISYRLFDDVFALVAYLEGHKDPKDICFEVLAPEKYLNNFQPTERLRNHASHGGILSLTSGGEVFHSLKEAAEVYEKILDQVAPKNI